MGRKNKHAEVASPPEQETAVEQAPQSIDQIRAQHAQLTALRQDLDQTISTFRRMMRDDIRDVLQSLIDDQCNDVHKAFENCKPSEVSHLQGKLDAYKDCKALISGQTSVHQLDEVNRQLAELEEKNALFLAGPSEADRPPTEPGKVMQIDLAYSAIGEAETEMRLTAAGFITNGSGRWFADAGSVEAVELAKQLDDEGIAFEIRWETDLPEGMTLGAPEEAPAEEDATDLPAVDEGGAEIVEAAAE